MKAILMYHSVDESGSVISIGEAAFRRHAAWLASRGPQVVPLSELLRLPPEEPALAITFDDAFANFRDVAWPILQEYGLPATLYVPTGHVGGTNAWGGLHSAGIPTLPLLDWEALGRLAEAGVALGSHTRTHPHLARLPAAAIHEELAGSAAELRAMLGIRAAGLAYPYGSWDETVAEAAKEYYDHAVTVELRALRCGDPPHRLPRVDTYYLRSEGMLEAWGSTRLRWYLSARAGVRRARSAISAGSAA